MNELFNIKDNVTVITGGTGVLGRTIAKYLAKNGAKVIILGRKEDVGNKIVEDIKKEGYHAEFMKTDVMNQELVQKNCDDIIASGNQPEIFYLPLKQQREEQSANWNLSQPRFLSPSGGDLPHGVCRGLLCFQSVPEP